MKRINLLILIFAGFQVNGKDLRWQNNYDQPLHFQCPTYQSISYIHSIHHNHHEDRLWDFRCKSTFDNLPDCSWSVYVNNFDQEFTYICPYNGVISGMNSFHENRHEDRRWQFQCCRVSNVCNFDCFWTPYINYFDEDINWNVPSQNYLVGAESYHHNKHEDRRWKYLYCTRRSC
ncbi:hemagglutinin/amebocyte aggregation factor-like isoform X2 [Amia ocellicauda]